MILVWCVVWCVMVCGVAYGEQTYVLTGLGNLFVVDGHVSPNGTDALHMEPREFEGFFLAGGHHDADIVSFHDTYHIPYVVAADSDSVYAAVRDTYVSSVVPNHGTYLYRNGHLELSTFGLDHVLGTLYGRIFEGPASWRSGAHYTTFDGGGRAAYTLQYVTYGRGGRGRLFGACGVLRAALREYHGGQVARQPADVPGDAGAGAVV